jgi:choline dehydrogenase
MTALPLETIDGHAVLAQYDYIVVGSGSAGSVVAARLAEDTHCTVLMIEAGPRDSSICIRMPAALGLPLADDRFNWYLHTEPEPGLDHRAIYEARGRVLGGSSSINGMNWVRGSPWDYEQWEMRGLSGWGYAHCLPYFRKAESFDRGSNRYRGGSGPMRIETCAARGPLYEAFLQAGEQAGYLRVSDHNAYRQEGVHVTQRNVHQGLRWSTSRAYIHAVGPRDNLHVLCNCRVQRVLLAGLAARGVEVIAGDVSGMIAANREVILCAGAIHSPHLLMHSGIGDAEELRRHGLPVTQHLPGVGRNLKDHVAAPLQYRCARHLSAARQLSGLGRLQTGINWLLFKRGLGATNFFEVGAFIRTRDDVAVPDVQFEFVPMLGEFQHGGVKLDSGFQYFFSLMRPTSAGRVRLRSGNPLDAPAFWFNYLQTAADCQTAVAAVKAVRNVVAQAAWSELRGAEVAPGTALQSDAEILAFLRRAAGTNYHPCCSCRMGADPEAVVDSSGRVHGLQGLRVIDASILPEIVSGNLNAPVIMVAEKLADEIRGTKPLAAEPAPYYLAGNR